MRCPLAWFLDWLADYIIAGQDDQWDEWRRRPPPSDHRAVVEDDAHGLARLVELDVGDLD